MKINRLFCSSALLLALSTSVSAGMLDCTGCHAEKSDIRPIDAAYRNVSSGGFIGSHRAHVPASASFNSCIPCHNNDSYTSTHRDGKIQLSMKINNYSNPIGNAQYITLRTISSASGIAFFNQTSIPVPGRCANVNCHFESTTPVWGSGAVTCSLCHGLPPAGVSPGFGGGAAGSHGKHDSYFNGVENCNKCHTDHNAESNPYAHATSAGKRSLYVSLRDPQNMFSGTYSNSDVSVIMPSQAAGKTYGVCTDIYCHSPGNRSAAVLPPAKAAVWGGSLGCNGCHQTVPVSGSHKAHLLGSFGVSVPCYTCHAATVGSDNKISSTSKHVNKKIDITFGGFSASATGMYGGTASPVQKAPGADYADCTNVYCHSSGQGNGGTWPPKYSAPKWGDPSTGQCGSCHDDGVHNAGSLLQTGSHAQHLRYDFGVGARENVCGVCHYGTGFAETDGFCGQCHFKSDNLITKHINGQVEVDFVSKFGGVYTGTPKPGDGYGTCSTIYCHSDGTSVSSAVVSASATAPWGGAGSGGCSGCHGFPPAYVNGAPKANSHAGHSQFSCNSCHSGTTNDGVTITSFISHVNKKYDVQPGSGISFTYVYDPAGGTCSAISCHFNNKATWGTTLRCIDCHATSPGDQ